jgi:hypothetical protein
MVPTGVTGCDQGSVIQGDDTGDTEVLAATGAGRKGLAFGGAIAGLGGNADGQSADGKHTEQHTQSQTNGNDAFCVMHSNYSSLLNEICELCQFQYNTKRLLVNGKNKKFQLKFGVKIFFKNGTMRKAPAGAGAFVQR